MYMNNYSTVSKEISVKSDKRSYMSRFTLKISKNSEILPHLNLQIFKTKPCKKGSCEYPKRCEYYHSN